MDTRKYYEAYEERYKTAHEKGVSWAGKACTPIVMETVRKYGVPKAGDLLEIGCGEGRDAREVLKHGYRLLATDVSEEAVSSGDWTAFPAGLTGLSTSSMPSRSCTCWSPTKTGKVFTDSSGSI